MKRKKYWQISFFFVFLMVGNLYSQTKSGGWYIAGPAPVGFESEINAFLQQDSASFPPVGAWLFTGSSTIRKWEHLATDFHEIPVIQRGFGGSTMKALNYYARYIVLPYKPCSIVVYEGDNDLVSGTTPGEFIAQCDTFIGKVHGKLPNTKIWFVSVKPSFARSQYLPAQNEINKQLKKLVRHRPNTGFIDITQLMYDRGRKLKKEYFESDSLHVNEACYRSWAVWMKAALGIPK